MDSNERSSGNEGSERLSDRIDSVFEGRSGEDFSIDGDGRGASVSAQGGDEDEHADSSWRMWLVMLLVLAPAAYWMMARGADTEPPSQTASRGNAQAAAAAINLSVQHYQAGRYQEAVDAARTALTSDPSSSLAWSNITAAQIQLGNVDAAIEAGLAAVRLDPQSKLAQGNLAWARGEVAKKRVASLPPGAAEQAEKLAAEALQLTLKGDFEGCIGKASEAVTLNPTAGDAFNYLGWCQYKSRMYEASAASLQRAVDLSPGVAMFANNLRLARQSLNTARQ
jgi:tetratricopeptide (TPR) repeat protein